jgi:5-methylcytosine-specific restriction endonuclease McrA
MSRQAQEDRPITLEDIIEYNMTRPFEKRKALLYGEKVDGAEEEKYQVLRLAEHLPSFLVGGLPNFGKTSCVAFLACQIVLCLGKIIVIDPHMFAPKDSLAKILEPLSPWLAMPMIDFEDTSQVVRAFQLVQDLYEQRNTKGATDFYPVFLLCDEWNLLLDSLDKEELEIVVKAVRTVARSARKYSIWLGLIAQNWNLSSSGGSDVRKAITGRFCYAAEDADKRMILNTRDTATLDKLCREPLRKGQAIFKHPEYGMKRVCYPPVTKADCQAVAFAMHRVLGGYTLPHTKQTPYAITAEEIIESMQNGQYAYSPYSPGAHGHNVQQRSSPDNTVTLTTDLSQNGIFHSPVSGEQFSTLKEPIPRSDDNFPFTDEPPPVPNTFPAQVFAPHVQNTPVSPDDRLLIIQAGNQQLAKTGKVVRTKILEDLRRNTNDHRWNNKALWKVTAICEEMGWHAKMKPHKQLSTQDKQALKEQAGNTCQQCGSIGPLEIHHISPRMYGVDNAQTNMMVVCAKCHYDITHHKKGAKQSS